MASRTTSEKARVCFLLGSKSDLEVAERGAKVLETLKVPYAIHVASAHRTPKKVERIVSESKAEVFVCVAGLSAALPGVVAAMTTRPVIGVPVGEGLPLDSILSCVQMPPGIPVAAVGANRGDNAALLAASILALKDPALADGLSRYRKEMAEKVEADDASIQPR